ncbi:MAG: hypothetical protein A4E28_02002 [Methanocella sp. PtaU1.Bin125]|nr:MAG: hypothetical protein A4E28_02002 [Methanocella sp. PtaU1.Bin125]
MKKRALIVLATVALFLVLSPGQARASADTGYRPDRDGFGFANFGDPVTVAGVDLNMLAGVGFHDEIFSHTGHCFGMAVASVQRYGNGNGSIGLAAEDVMPEIDRIQTEQSFYYIADFFRPPFGEKTYDCSREYARLLARLSEGRPAVIGVYSSTGSYPGHAVVAYKIETAGEKSYIYVYDPNFPATLRDYEEEPMIAVYDAEGGTFLYDNGRTFDEMRLDDVDGTGVVLGKTLSAGFVGVPCMAIALLIWRPLSRRHH